MKKTKIVTPFLLVILAISLFLTVAVAVTSPEVLIQNQKDVFVTAPEPETEWPEYALFQDFPDEWTSDSWVDTIYNVTATDPCNVTVFVILDGPHIGDYMIVFKTYDEQGYNTFEHYAFEDDEFDEYGSGRIKWELTIPYAEGFVGSHQIFISLYDTAPTNITYNVLCSFVSAP